ncbi:MAG: ARPP-1 family domain-containing protein [Planctomycetota bacterium]|jgi:hypothetical protein
MNRCAFLAGVVLFAACGSSPEGPTKALARIDDNHYLGAAVTAENLTVWPIYADKALDIGEFLTLEEAHAKKLAEVREVGGPTVQQESQVVQQEGQAVQQEGQAIRQEGQAIRQEGQAIRQEGQAIRQEGQILQQGREGSATVGRVVIENKGDLPILVVAGTLVKGGKQDRQIGQDFVVKAKSETLVDAFCVEQGRWSFQESTVNFGVTNFVASKGVRVGGQYLEDQGEVWKKVATMNAARSIIEGTSLHNANFHADPRFFKVEERLRKQVKAHFAGLERKPVGFAYAINGKPVTIRTFAHERICADQLNGFVNTMCMEAQVAGEEAKAPAREASAEDVVALVRAIDAAKEELKETSAANTNGYRKTDLGYGATCYFELEGKRRVALTRDWTSK